MCLRIGLELNFSGKKLREMAISGLFHDIGMMKISPEIWNREGSLSDEEYKKVKDHPLFGEGMFTNIDDLTEVIPLVIGQHQEKIDGSGYPGHLTIDNIHYLSRLISLVDRYETQTHRRQWKKKVLPDKAIQDLLDNQAGKFDPHFLKALLRVVSIYPEGCYVRISSGEICEVIKTNKAKPMRPIVMMLYDNSKNRMPGGKVLDLSKQVLVHVDKCVDPSEFQI
jgi:HD-GYP domain-containing protein (c-di-GMP phosphodiesterase class II)